MAMKMILTDDVGLQAAQMVCPATGEVTELTVEDGKSTLLIYKHDPRTFPTDLRRTMDTLMQMIPHIAPSGTIMVISMPVGDEIATVPESEFRKLGLRRI